MKPDQVASISSVNKRSKIARGTSIIMVVVSSMLALTLGLMMRPWLAERSVIAKQLIQSNAQRENETSQFTTPIVSGKALDQIGLMGTNGTSSEAKMLSQRVNNIEVSASNFRVEKSQLLVDVCFEMPDNADWTVWHASLKYGLQETTAFGSIPIEVRELPSNGWQRVITFDKTGRPTERWELASEGEKGRRCDTLYFDIQAGAEISDYNLNIQAIAAYPREGEVCDSSYLNKVQKSLDARNSGITVQCNIEDIGMGGMSGLMVKSKPAWMSIEEAEAFISSDELFIDVYGVRGPWEFSYSLK